MGSPAEKGCFSKQTEKKKQREKWTGQVFKETEKNPRIL